MKTLDDIRAALADRNLRKVAAGAGISEASVYRAVKAGSKPAYETVKALSDYLERSAGVAVDDE